MRVATTKNGKKLHLIDPNSSDLKDTITSCGRTRVFWTVIHRPVKGTVCQTCVRTALARMKRLLLGKPDKPTVLGPGKPGKRKISPPGSSSQKKLKRAKAKGPPLTEGKTKHVRKGGTK